MDEPSGAGRFRELPGKEQERYLDVMRELTTFARGHATPICFAPPLGTFGVPLGEGKMATVTLPLSLGNIDGASGCVLRLESGVFVITADHVLTTYENRLAKGERLNWQVGKLPPFDPRVRVIWRDQANLRTPEEILRQVSTDEAPEKPSSLIPYRPKDIVFLKLSEQEAQQACGDRTGIVPTPADWPPALLEVGQLVVLAGYPNQLKEVDLAGTMTRGACSAVFRVTTVGDGNGKCQFAYEDLINFSVGSPLPNMSTANLGGMSGGPVFVLASFGEYGEIQYPRLTGVFIERWGHDPTSDIVEIATFDGTYESDFRTFA